MISEGCDCFGCRRSQQMDVDGSRSLLCEQLVPKWCSSLDWFLKHEKKYARTVLDKAEKKSSGPTTGIVSVLFDECE